jgi:hypothetical protein
MNRKSDRNARFFYELPAIQCVQYVDQARLTGVLLGLTPMSFVKYSGRRFLVADSNDLMNDSLQIQRLDEVVSNIGT